MRFFGVTVLKQGTLSLYRGSRCMYLVSTHGGIAEGHPQLLRRFGGAQPGGAL